MDFKKLDEIITLYCSKIGIYKDTINQVYPMAIDIIQKDNPPIEKLEWSRSFELSESIRIVYMFLCDIDKELANKYLNIIKDENIVKIKSRKENSNEEDCVDSEGVVHINYENTPNDIFIILHEMLHKLNEQKNDEHIENYTRDYFGESVSITGEMLIGKYMVENGIITENDFNMRKLKRLNGSRDNARDIIIERILIEMKMSGREINKNNLLQVINNCADDTLRMILTDESKDLKRIRSIFKNYEAYQHKDKNLVDVLNTRKSQRYVIGTYLSNEFIGKENEIEDFLSLHYAVADKDANINDIVDDIRKKHPTL